MSNIPSMTPKDVVRILQQKGFTLDRSGGSHQIWLHPVSRKPAIVHMQQRFTYRNPFRNSETG